MNKTLSENRYSNKNKKHQKVDSKVILTYNFILIDFMNPGWLREMDGENTEEDRRLHTNCVEFTGQDSNLTIEKNPLSLFTALNYNQ
jgi:hypothetical protein